MMPIAIIATVCVWLLVVRAYINKEGYVVRCDICGESDATPVMLTIASAAFKKHLPRSCEKLHLCPVCQGFVLRYSYEAYEAGYNAREDGAE